MAITQIVKGVYSVPMGMANAFLVEDTTGLLLIDAGYPGKEVAVFKAIQELGYSLRELKHILLTHAHPDHVGSAAKIVSETRARTYMHLLDAPIAECGGPFRPLVPAPGFLRHMLCKLLYHPHGRVAPISIDQPLSAGDILPIAGGIEVIHVPGHCLGQVALLMRRARVLFAGDVCMNVMGLGDPVGFESLELGRESQRKVASLSFEVATFGHGAHLSHDASTFFRQRFANTGQRKMQSVTPDG